jgi:hypothetical protein
MKRIFPPYFAASRFLSELSGDGVRFPTRTPVAAVAFAGYILLLIVFEKIHVAGRVFFLVSR